MSKRLRIVVAAGAPIVVVMIYALRNYILYLKRFLPECSFHKLTGYWCTGCGSTRCVTALLQFKLLTAIRNNATIPFLGFLLVMLYIENLLFLFFGKEIRLLPRNGVFWGIVMGLFFVYFIVRNFIPAIAPIS